MAFTFGGLFSSSARQKPSSTPLKSEPASAIYDDKENGSDLLGSAIRTGSGKAVEYALLRQQGRIERKPSEVVNEINRNGGNTDSKVTMFNLFARIPGFDKSIENNERAQNTLDAGHNTGPFLIKRML